MLISRRTALALVAVLSRLLCVLPPAAPATAPGTVTVRVGGSHRNQASADTGDYTATPLSRDGNRRTRCPGDECRWLRCSLPPAATGEGPGTGKFNQYEIYSIEGEIHEFEPASSCELLLGVLARRQGSYGGICDTELQPGDRGAVFPRLLRRRVSTRSRSTWYRSSGQRRIGEAVHGHRQAVRHPRGKHHRVEAVRALPAAATRARYHRLRPGTPL